MAVIIHFLGGNSINTQHHYSEKGYRDDVIVQIDQKYYEVYFYEESVMKYDMTDDGFFSMPGLIVLETIDHDRIVRSIKYLYETGYFNWFAGFNEMFYKKPFLSKWYLNEMSAYDKSQTESLVIVADK